MEYVSISLLFHHYSLPVYFLSLSSSLIHVSKPKKNVYCGTEGVHAMSLSSNNGSTFMCVVDRLLCHSFMCGGAVNGRWLAAGGQDRHRTTGV